MTFTDRFPQAARRALAGSLALIAVAAGLSACVTHVVEERPVIVRPPPPPPAPHVVVRAMPAPVHEDRGNPPGPGFNWVPGHWRWAGNDWLWQHGQWVRQPVPPMPPVIIEQIGVPPSPQHVWVPGHWVWRPEAGGWAWVRGTWYR